MLRQIKRSIQENKKSVERDSVDSVKLINPCSQQPKDLNWKSVVFKCKSKSVIEDDISEKSDMNSEPESDKSDKSDKSHKSNQMPIQLNKNWCLGQNPLMIDLLPVMIYKALLSRSIIVMIAKQNQYQIISATIPIRVK